MQNFVARLAGRLWRQDQGVRVSASPEVARAGALCRKWRTPMEPSAPGKVGPAGDSPVNSLRQYFEANRQGPGIWKWEHYFEIYHRHLAKFVGVPAHVVEVGVYSGGSLGMWRDYFGRQCRLSGIDIEPACRVYARAGIEIFIGDQADRRFWQQFRQQTPPADVVLDDGGHEPEQQMVTLEETLPHLKPGGVYVCEDIHGIGNRFALFAHTLADHLNTARWRGKETGMTACDPAPLQATVHSVHCYPFVVVIEMQAAPLHALQAPKHGTQWQPFL